SAADKAGRTSGRAGRPAATRVRLARSRTEKERWPSWSTALPRRAWSAREGVCALREAGRAGASGPRAAARRVPPAGAGSAAREPAAARRRVATDVRDRTAMTGSSGEKGPKTTQVYPPLEERTRSRPATFFSRRPEYGAI